MEDVNSLTTIVDSATTMNLYIHPMIQLALLAILPLVMQGLKQIAWVEKQKVWVCPLLCIAVSTGAAYFLHLPQWWLVGILTGATCNKIYDWSKDYMKGANP